VFSSSLLSIQKAGCDLKPLKTVIMETKLNPYLNFDGNCEAAFNYYKKVFGGEFAGQGIMRFGQMPECDEMPPLAEEHKNRVMHVSLPIGNELLMGSDIMPGFGSGPFQFGDSIYVSIHPESKEEADRLFKELSEGGSIEMPLEEMFWGDYFGSCRDQFGIQWMINYNSAGWR
jgi:PhnB protein